MDGVSGVHTFLQIVVRKKKKISRDRKLEIQGKKGKKEAGEGTIVHSYIQ